MTILSKRITRSVASASALLVPTPACRSYLLCASQAIAKKHPSFTFSLLNRSGISPGCISFIGSLTSSRSPHHRPGRICALSETRTYIMSRRSSRAAAVVASAKIREANDDEKIESPMEEDDSTTKSLESTAKNTEVTKKTMPKKAKGGADPAESHEEHDTQKVTKKKSTTKRMSLDDTSTSEPINPPKKKAKAPDHQRWTERTPLTKLWDPQIAMQDTGSYTFTVVSWNIAGLRTFIKKNPDAISNLASRYDADVICLQETKLQEEHLDDPKLKLKEYFDEKLNGYECHFSCSVVKKGYSGTAMFIRKYGDKVDENGPKKGKKQATLGAFFATKTEHIKETKSKHNEGDKLVNIPITNLRPVTVSKHLGIPAHDGEGRTITAEFPLFYLTNVYVPNSGQNLDRLSYRTEYWDKDFVTKMRQLEKDGSKPIIWLGDLNVAYDEKDTWNEGAKHLNKSAGTTPEERASFAEQLSAGFVDAFRYLHPDGRGHYSYWSQRAGNREPNKGLRLDYFVCSKGLMSEGGTKTLKKAIVRDSYMVHDQLGSDHCPIVLEIEIKRD
ncbi:hypothetical protein HJC23_010551 [Cyclotella cryptica]|uniref:DNA-(apurinic or apyrimidinic site) endonuclease n=1 Tax=Cyclotella cryptica TaxID=29204 RepID=A0ABD3QBB6_9STRA|eukprot:CCRYP_007143-RA/>CCRYP_007143-RA protein AED:0.13 eAED:0.13 QI:286/1/1/1/1/1/2/158/557